MRSRSSWVSHDLAAVDVAGDAHEQWTRTHDQAVLKRAMVSRIGHPRTGSTCFELDDDRGIAVVRVRTGDQAVGRRDGQLAYATKRAKSKAMRTKVRSHLEARETERVSNPGIYGR